MPDQKTIKKPKKTTVSSKSKAEKTTVTVKKSGKESSKKAIPVKSNNEATLSIGVINTLGKPDGTIKLNQEIFGDKINKRLLSQAVRVYQANRRQGNASTKTRGEVDGSTRKIYRQKGTGRARHGSIRAPIFVKGGVVFGPRPHDYGMDLPRKMRVKALFNALSVKQSESQITVISGLEKIEPKTKQFVAVLKNLGFSPKAQNMLLVASDELENVKRASRNVEGVRFINVKRLNALSVLNTKNVLFMKEALVQVEKHFLKNKKGQALETVDKKEQL